MVIAIDFMLIDTMFVSHLYGFLSTGHELYCVMVIAIDFMFVNTMFESYPSPHPYGSVV